MELLPKTAISMTAPVTVVVLLLALTPLRAVPPEIVPDSPSRGSSHPVRYLITKSPDAVIAPGDRLNLYVTIGSKILIREQLTVNELGTIYLPDINRRHKVAHHTLDEATRAIAPLYDTPRLYPASVTSITYAPIFRNTALDK